jgi:alpha-ketoglutarate-dependent taurine dioxygenase
VLSCVFNASSAKQAERRMGIALPEREMALLDRIVALAQDDEMRLDMVFEPGDIQLLNNYTVLHWRTAFRDFPEPERKRRLYRLWLNRPGERPVDPAMHRGYITGSKAGLPVLA